MFAELYILKKHKQGQTNLLPQDRDTWTHVGRSVGGCPSIFFIFHVPGRSPEYSFILCVHNEQIDPHIWYNPDGLLICYKTGVWDLMLIHFWSMCLSCEWHHSPLPKEMWLALTWMPRLVCSSFVYYWLILDLGKHGYSHMSIQAS